ncbi:MAG: hypothetical protein ACM3U1_00575 [Chloroflexota bacterium]
MRLVFALLAFFIFSFFAYSQDMVIKNSGERILCKIEKEDSLNIYITITKKGREPLSAVISKSDIKVFEYDYEPPAQLVTVDGVQPVYQPTYRQYGSLVSIGILHGGGSLIGADIELPVGDNYGLQAGAGYLGFGAAFNYHFKPTIRSSCISLQYLHQGIRGLDDYLLECVGPSYIYRADSWFTCQVGLAYIINQDVKRRKEFDNMKWALTFAIGAYIAL